MDKKSKLKIGLLIDPSRRLVDWEIKIIYEIIFSNFAEITCVFYDPAARKIQKSFFEKLILGFKNNTIYSSILRKFIEFIENKYSKLTRFDELKIVKNFFLKVEKIQIQSTKKKYDDYFDKKQCDLIKSKNLDILFRRDFRILKGEILNCAKFGVWSFHHGDNDFFRGLPPGFWECYLNENVTGVTLQKLTHNLDAGEIIDKGFYSTKFYWLLNKEFIYEKSVSIFIKNLKLLYGNQRLDAQPSNASRVKIYRSPNFLTLLKYILKKYPLALFNKLFINNFYTRKNKNIWKLHIGKGNIESRKLNDLVKFQPPDGEYWADPFVLTFDNKNFVFFENYEFKNKRSKISTCEITNEKIIKVRDALKLDYHLSYPFVWKENNNFFMMPETAQKKRIEIWQADNFPSSWKLKKILFEGQSFADTTFFIDSLGNKWLFTNKSTDKFDDHNSELYIYKILGDNFENIEPHKCNPVIIDSKVARNAGKIFYDHNGNLIRPSQMNISNIYGHALNINKIIKLSINEYVEEKLFTIKPGELTGVRGIHHISQERNFFILDACYHKR